MVEAFLAQRFSLIAPNELVHSAGMLREGDPPPIDMISVMADYGLDVTAHRSRVVTCGDLADAGLVLAMTREHVRCIVVRAPDAWPRTFTLKELVRRGEEAGPRPPGESLASWLRRVHDGRERRALLGECFSDDVADPMDGPPQTFAATAAQLAALADRLVGLGWGNLAPATHSD